METCIKILLLLTVTLSGIGAQTSRTCPSSISPCKCKMVSSVGPRVSCEDLGSMGQMQNPLARMQGYSLDSLEILNSKFGVVPADLFRGISIANLSLSSVTITALGSAFQPPFLGLENSLETLKLSNCFTEERPLMRMTFGHLKKLRSLTLEANVIPHMFDDWFENGPYSLTELRIEGNVVEEGKVGRLVFSTLGKLARIAFTGNKIGNVYRSMFPSPATKLSYLDLSDNDITNLHDGIFEGMPALHEVLLNDNALFQLDQDTWMPVWDQLTHVELKDNPISCNSTIEWIYKVPRRPSKFLGNCANPKSLRGRELSNLTLSDLQ